MGYTRVTGVWSNIFPREYLWIDHPSGARRVDRGNPSRQDAHRARRFNGGRRRRVPVAARPGSSTTEGGCLSISSSRPCSPPTGSVRCSAWVVAGSSSTCGRPLPRSSSAASPLCSAPSSPGESRSRASSLPAPRSRSPGGSPGTTPASRASRAGPSTRASCKHARPSWQDLWLWAAAVRVHHRDHRPVRLDRGDDGAALLDRRVHGHDRRSALRVLDDDALPLPRSGRVLASRRVIEPGLVLDLSGLRSR